MILWYSAVHRMYCDSKKNNYVEGEKKTPKKYQAHKVIFNGNYDITKIIFISSIMYQILNHFSIYPFLYQMGAGRSRRTPKVMANISKRYLKCYKSFLMRFSSIFPYMPL